MSIFQPGNPAINFKYSFTGSVASFRAKLLRDDACRCAVTTATGVSLRKIGGRIKKQVPDVYSQSWSNFFLKIQEAQSWISLRKMFAISHAVRLRAALEERDIDDLYQTLH